MSAEVVTSHAHVVIVHPATVMDGSLHIATCGSQLVAERIAALINRHGLADVPDDARTITEQETQ